ncbi:hypothetical protein H0A66_02850 [Alcaligenaceae bacterium]|nr:hypothetical protein [Alcaligenaceae bacterium]
MSISERDLIDLAKASYEYAQDEVDHRSAISRAYYAAYHRCLDFHSRLPYGGKEPRGGGGVHDKLIHRLKNPTITNEALSAQSCELGHKLQTLKMRRNVADYRLERTVRPEESELTIREVEVLLQSTGG